MHRLNNGNANEVGESALAILKANKNDNKLNIILGSLPEICEMPNTAVHNLINKELKI